MFTLEVIFLGICLFGTQISADENLSGEPKYCCKNLHI